ncbi:MAG: hypothetical protein AB1634_05165 [Thermodesulfobacteriota bacterium]
MPAAERRDYGEVVLAQRLRDALAQLNPALPPDALEDAKADAAVGRSPAGGGVVPAAGCRYRR